MSEDTKDSFRSSPRELGRFVTRPLFYCAYAKHEIHKVPTTSTRRILTREGSSVSVQIGTIHGRFVAIESASGISCPKYAHDFLDTLLVQSFCASVKFCMQEQKSLRSISLCP